MERDANDSVVDASSSRWTCEACGCNTNSSQDRSCSICGTGNDARSSVIRRINYSGPGLFARGIAARRGLIHEALGVEGYESWERDEEEVQLEVNDGDYGQPFAAFAMEVAFSGRDVRRQRAAVEAVRSLALSPREVMALEPSQLHRIASENCNLYRPTWMNPSRIGGRIRTGNGIEVGDGQHQNVAHLPLGAGEGRALRALEAFPRSTNFASLNLDLSTSTNSIRRPRRAFGFKVAFEYPNKMPGESMGGDFLVGVTTTSFAAFSEKNSLQQSSMFWGIEDNGQKYEGARSFITRERMRETVGIVQQSDVVAGGQNSRDILFGSMEVVTCVVDFESRSLTFWRDHDLLGTLISNLPRGGHLYPICVPSKAGCSVAISCMNEDPIPLLQSFSSNWKKNQTDKIASQREKLREQRSAIISNGLLSPSVEKILHTVFSWYSGKPHRGQEGNPKNYRLRSVEAGRLWYRCGMKISHLRAQLGASKDYVTFEDFLKIMKKIAQEDEEWFSAIVNVDDGYSTKFQTGDKVQLVEGYERFGDATKGPLQSLDRGTVIDLQQGSDNETYSVRVVHGGRRWWYQPQAIVREKSGLIESPGVWFISSILRKHGFDPIKLQLLVGREVSSSSWQVDDLVVPRIRARQVLGGDVVEQRQDIFRFAGRIVNESTTISDISSVPQSEKSEGVLVEFLHEEFAKACGVANGGSSRSLKISSLPVRELVYTSIFFGEECLCADSALLFPTAGSNSSMNRSMQKPVDNVNSVKIRSQVRNAPVSGLTKEDRARISQHDTLSVESIIIECENSETKLASLLGSGLSDSILGALDSILRRMKSGDDCSDLANFISSLGRLVCTIVQKASPGTPSSMKTSTISRHHTSSSSEVEDHNTKRNIEEHKTSQSYVEEDRTSLQNRGNVLTALIGRTQRKDSPRTGGTIQIDTNNAETYAVEEGLPHSINPSQQDSTKPLLGTVHQEQGAQSICGSQSKDDASKPAMQSQESKADHQDDNQALLDRICRYRTNGSRNYLSDRMMPTVVKAIVTNGLLVDSLPWVSTVIDTQKRANSSRASSTRMPPFQTASDEEGTPLLELALTFGCSWQIIRALLESGCVVSKNDIKIAAYTDQPQALTELLQCTFYVDGTVDLDKCSLAIAGVLKRARLRQQVQREKFLHDAVDLSLSFFEKICEIGILCRRLGFKDTCCESAVVHTLVGHISLRSAEKLPVDLLSAPVQRLENRDCNRLGAESICSGLASTGLLDILSDDFFPALLDEEQRMTKYLLLMEEHLCSKNVNDSAIGLSLLSILLTRIPTFCSSSEIERYGFTGLVASHDALAADQLAELSGNVGAERPGEVSKCSATTLQAQVVASGIIFCPKRHRASLHITRHSSFRCDLCGKGVERGKAMHGCRECDWDACEGCTDKSEGGVAKWEYIRATAKKCLEVISANENQSSIGATGSVLKGIHSTENLGIDVNNLSIRILQRDVGAIEELVAIMSGPGLLSNHQFITVILPALHSALLGTKNREYIDDISAYSHRSKKPRLGNTRWPNTDFVPVTSRENIHRFAVELLRHFEKDKITSHSCSTFKNENTTNLRNDCNQCDDNTSQHFIRSELLNRIHKVLALHESVSLSSMSQDSLRNNLKGASMQALLEPIAVSLLPSSAQGERTSRGESHSLEIHTEPLVSIKALSLCVLRSRNALHPQFLRFCHGLVFESAIILERPLHLTQNKSHAWRLARVLSFNAEIGYHTIQYANGLEGKVETHIDLRSGLRHTVDMLAFDGESSKIMIAAREFFVLHRRAKPREGKAMADGQHLFFDDAVGSIAEQDNKQLFEEPLNPLIGYRVSRHMKPLGLQSYTILAVRKLDNREGEKKESFVLVSDEGDVLDRVLRCQMRGLAEGSATMRHLPDSRSQHSGAWIAESSTSLRSSLSAPDLNRDSSQHQSSIFKQEKSPVVLRRCWSALSLRASMSPIDIKPDLISMPRRWKCKFGADVVELLIDDTILEVPPRLHVRFGWESGSVPMNVPDETTLGSLLLNRKKCMKGTNHEAFKLHFTVTCKESLNIKEKGGCHYEGRSVAWSKPNHIAVPATSSRYPMFPSKAMPFSLVPRFGQGANRLRESMNFPESIGENACILGGLCNGLDEICTQCMELLGLFAEIVEHERHEKIKDIPLSAFQNKELSHHLAEQLENPLVVVSGALPTWCFAGPAYAPHVFNYNVRRLLLQRAAFGVSRSTLKQQESKVNVSRLRQRMASLRAKAVELVGEAFRGGAADPTALQLQADELYGMEEALAVRVRATFRAERWEEHTIEVAKAAVNRNRLITDAVAVMQQYAEDSRVNRRRLEVRFDGESGFDAASGDEAGVTRGFYADVAEALLSCDVVAGVRYALVCYDEGASVGSKGKADSARSGLSCRLPLWIPDVDSSGQVVIPTPRAGPQSVLGVFPRPISRSDPIVSEVLNTFRFMGRLFASAMRDGFMFPLPLSASFLKLVQFSGGWHLQATSRSSSHSTGPLTDAVGQMEVLLSSVDLPRPGFLGGDIAAAEIYVCAALDRLDNTEPPLSSAEMNLRYQEIAADKSFARRALGKSYECSFEDYFEGRTFVDPLDPIQGVDAVPLCPYGHTRRVTIHNIREWVALSKRFVLYEGVVSQALAFREGVEDFFPSGHLRLFSSIELQKDVCGVGDNVDDWHETDVRALFKLDGGKGAAEALVAVAAIGGEGGAALSRRFGPNSPTIRFVVKALLDATPKMRRQFLSFVTSVPIVTPGQIEVVPVVSPGGDFLPVRDPSCLPRANTCAKRLYLPKFETYESFSDILWTVVRAESKFKGFYEWRGSN